MVTDLLTVKSQRGKLPHGWRTGRLDELVDLNPEQLTSEYPLTRIAYLDISNVSKGQVKETVEMPLSEAPSRAKRIVRAGDTLLSTVRPGNRAYAYFRSPPDNLVCSTGFAVLRARRESTDGRFAYYLASSDPIIEHLATIAEKQTAYPSVNPCDIGECLVPIPPLAEQRAIARVLGSLDDKIELNRRMNKTLEEICRALFKFWFVDFGPVRAKAEGRWKKGESLPGMPADMWDLWPSEFEESEIGEIPKGWEVRRLAEVADVSQGSTPSTENDDFWDPPAQDWVTVKDLSQSREQVLSRTERKVSRKGLEYLGSKVVPSGSILLSTGAPIGYVAISAIPLALGTRVAALQPHDPLGQTYTYQWVRASVDVLRDAANGTTFPQLLLSTLREFPILVPSAHLLSLFETLLSPAEARVAANEAESHSLAATRDALLPKLLSGEIRVKVEA
jgi:type I restriction enzyme S subunit